MKAELKAGLLVFSVVFVVIQVLPGVGRVNPPVSPLAGPQPAAVHDVLKRACYDCHSNETEWPASSRVAPVGWAVESHVYGGRAKMNLSYWPDDPSGQAAARRKIADVVTKGRMPLKSYWFANEHARLSDEEVRLIQAWAAEPVPSVPLKEAAMRGGHAAVIK